MGLEPTPLAPEASALSAELRGQFPKYNRWFPPEQEYRISPDYRDFVHKAGDTEEKPPDSWSGE